VHAGFKGQVEGAAARLRLCALQGEALSMGLAGPFMVCAGDFAAGAVEDDRAHHRIRTRLVPSLGSLDERFPHPALVVVLGRAHCPPTLSVAASDLLEAVLAVDGTALSRQEWHLCDGAAYGARHLVHRSRARYRPSFASQCSTFRTAAGFVEQAFGLIELLLASTEDELDAAVTADECAVDKGRHGFPSSVSGRDVEARGSPAGARCYLTGLRESGAEV
jgi:hypothetical protein